MARRRVTGDHRVAPHRAHGLQMWIASTAGRRAVDRPVEGDAVVLVQRHLVLARDRAVGLDAGAAADLVAAERDPEPSLDGVRVTHTDGRDKHLPARQPLMDVDHEVANLPATIVEEEIVHVAGDAVARRHAIFEQVVSALCLSHALTLWRGHERTMRAT